MQKREAKIWAEKHNVHKSQFDLFDSNSLICNLPSFYLIARYLINDMNNRKVLHVMITNFLCNTIYTERTTLQLQFYATTENTSLSTANV